MVNYTSDSKSPLLGDDISQPRCCGAATTITTSDGLIVKYLPNGDVLQHRPNPLDSTLAPPNIAGVLRPKD